MSDLTRFLQLAEIEEKTPEQVVEFDELYKRLEDSEFNVPDASALRDASWRLA